MNRFLETTILAVLLSAAGFSQNKVSVSGFVSDNNGAALPGVVISAHKDASATDYMSSTVSDEKGAYSITCTDNAVLRFQYLGLQTAEENVNGRLSVNVVMYPDQQFVLEQAVAIGYGSVSKADLTGAVTNVKMSEIRDVPVSSVDQALQGRIAGADIMTTDGEPGATTSIRIRGTRSISASNEPLYIVDGVMDAVRDINDLNPDDIESISVLKDASSTAIYGSMGANGVIIITTKSADNVTSGKPRITLKLSGGMSELPQGLDIMNASEYAMYKGLISPDKSKYWDPYSFGEGSDWISLMTRKAVQQKYDLTIQGGRKGNKYYASAGFLDNEGILLGTGQKKFTANVKSTHNLFKWLTADFGARFTYRKNDRTTAKINGSSRRSAQYLNPMLTPGTTWDEDETENGREHYNDPVSIASLQSYYLKRYTFSGNVGLTAKFAKHFEFKTQFSGTFLNSGSFRYDPGNLPRKIALDIMTGEAYRSEAFKSTLSSENTLTYKNRWAKRHSFDAMIGFTGFTRNYEDLSVEGAGYLSDDITWNNMNAVTSKETYNVNTSHSVVNKISSFARVNYNYRQRYYITLTGRADASSNFAENRKWGFFPSGALKWNIHKEKWMKKASNVDELSLKLSAGRTGNDAISAYRSLSALGTTTEAYLFNGTQPVSYYPSRIENPNLTWETTDMLNLALNGAFFNNRLDFDLELYTSRTTDLLLEVATAKATGYANRWTNIGQTSNKGIELSIDSRNIVKRDFSWDTSFTISHNKQMVLDCGTEEYISTYNAPSTSGGYMMMGYVKGYPLNSLWGFQYAGVWHNLEEIQKNNITHAYVSETAAKSTTLGAPKYVDVDNNGLINMDDLVYLGNADPVIYGGLQNNFRFKNFNLGVYFTYSLGGKLYNYAALWMSGTTRTNQYRYMLDSWDPVRNPDSDYPAAGVNVDSFYPSSFEVYDASFLRLQNVSLGYTFHFKKGLFKSLGLTLSGNNLLLWKNYIGFDPDISTSSDGSVLRRVDIGSYPKSRTYMFSVKLSY